MWALEPQLDTEIMNEEAKLSDLKRQATKEALGIKFGALLELSEKATVRLPFPFLLSSSETLADRFGRFYLLLRSSENSESCSSKVSLEF